MRFKEFIYKKFIIFEINYDKITNIGLLYIFEMTNEGAKNIGSVTMRKEGTYMLGEIG